MKKFLFAAALTCLTCPAANATEYVKAYTKKDGTYVAPHTRNSPHSFKTPGGKVKGHKPKTIK